MDMGDLPRWSINRTVLLGDASHPVLPHSFSGASMAIEDAVALARLLPEGIAADQIQGRLQLWEAIRKPRVAHVRDMGREIGGGRQDADFMGRYREFLSRYDVVADVEARLAALGKSL